jgi:hypothetical protein
VKAINDWIPPNVPIEDVRVLGDEQLTRIETHAQEMASAAESVAASVRATMATLT